MAKSPINWLGSDVSAKMKTAQIAGVNRTLGACVVEAKSNHPWENQTGVLEGGIAIVEYAVAKDGHVEGTWGVQDVRYAAAMELGADIEHPGGTPYYIDKDTGLAVFVSLASPASEGLPRTKPHEIKIPPHPFLRPAADKHYPSLTANIRKAFERGGAPASGGEGNG